jgi:hypothetical protein
MSAELHESPRPGGGGLSVMFGSGPDDGRLAARCTTRLQPPTEIGAVVREGVTKWHPGARCTRPGHLRGYPPAPADTRVERNQLKPRSSCLSAVSTVSAEASTMLASGSGSR